MNSNKNFTLKAVSSIGGQVKTSNVLGVSQPTVSRWLRKGEFPAEHVLKIESLTGISRHDLRPDIYPREAIEDKKAS